MYVFMYLPTPPHDRMWHEVNFAEFYRLKFRIFLLQYWLPKAEEPSLPYNLLIAERRIVGFIPFSRVLVLCEMQMSLSRILIRVTVFIFYDDNHYNTDTVKQCDFIEDNLILYDCYTM